MEYSVEDIKAIEEFIVNINVLDELDSQLNKFNVFETLGLIRTEIRHSNVLAWLLNPNENHGLGDTFIKKFIQSILISSNEKMSNCKLNIFDISLMDYYDVIIRREWGDIDILIESNENKLVICIENKITAKESPHQLEKYYKTINNNYKEYNKIFVFLTPDGVEASDEERWISANYTIMINLIQKSLELKDNNLTTEVKSFINQYLDTLRRYIVNNSDIETICKEIYYKHKKALDLIFENIPDRCSETENIIYDILSEYNNLLIFEKRTKTYIRFTTKILDNIIPKKGEGWTPTKRILLYEIQNREEKVVLKLIIGPGDFEVRKTLFDITEDNSELFKGKLKKLTGQFCQIYSKEILKKGLIESSDIETLSNNIRKEIESFINHDMVKINKVVSDKLK